MDIQTIIFIILAAIIGVCSILAITTKRILRSATFLLFVLFATAGIYFQLNYSFLGAVQLLIYASSLKCSLPTLQRGQRKSSGRSPSWT